MKVLNVLVVALIAAGIALAVTGKSTLKWAPPPLPQKSEAPAAQLARKQPAAVIVGHVDAAGVGPAVFYELGELRPGDRIYVSLADGRVAMFAVRAAALYPKTGFPAAAVYGYTSQSSLRLITCGGIFDPRTGHYLSNIVVFASNLGPA